MPLGTDMRFILGSLLLALAVPACNAPTGDMQQELTGMGCSVNSPDPRACDPADTKKTTVCHIPPGNPANAHTICVCDAFGKCSCSVFSEARVDSVDGAFVGSCGCSVC